MCGRKGSDFVEDSGSVKCRIECRLTVMRQNNNLGWVDFIIGKGEKKYIGGIKRISKAIYKRYSLSSSIIKISIEFKLVRIYLYIISLSIRLIICLVKFYLVIVQVITIYIKLVIIRYREVSSVEVDLLIRAKLSGRSYFIRKDYLAYNSYRYLSSLQVTTSNKNNTITIKNLYLVIKLFNKSLARVLFYSTLKYRYFRLLNSLRVSSYKYLGIGSRFSRTMNTNNLLFSVASLGVGLKSLYIVLDSYRNKGIGRVVYTKNIYIVLKNISTFSSSAMVVGSAKGIGIRLIRSTFSSIKAYRYNLSTIKEGVLIFNS
ncbi:hypothetical protein HDK77DRAFT_431502 [Phyllosticta capitalensis]